jgi:hypothetical protein
VSSSVVAAGRGTSEQNAAFGGVGDGVPVKCGGSPPELVSPDDEGSSFRCGVGAGRRQRAPVGG